MLDRGEELKRKAVERKEAPKKLKTVRDFTKVVDQISSKFQIFIFHTYMTIFLQLKQTQFN